MSSDLTSILDAATTDYVDSTNVDLDAGGRLAAARRFLRSAEVLAQQGGRALDFLEQATRQPDPWWRAAAAARMLAAIGTPDSARRLIDTVRGPAWAQFLTQVGLLGRTIPVHDQLPALDEVQAAARPSIARALFRHDNPRARATFESLLAEPGPALLIALDVAARWLDPELLRRAAARPELDAMLGARTHAAMVLALRGDEAARASLVEQANDPAPPRSAPAVLRLAYLADPDGVAPARSLLATTDEEALGTALAACAAYGAAALVEPLLEVAARGRGELSANALTTASAITGASIDDVAIDPGGIGEVIIDVRSRDRAVLRIRTALGELDRSLRYRGGRPLSLAILADDLTSPHSGPHTDAGWGLPAITGEDHGLVVGDDLIANADAVAAWQGRAHALALAFAPGGWARLGVPIELPGLP